MLVSQANGNVLPDWLSFEDITAILSGVPDENSTNVKIMVLADDRRGGTASTTFLISIDTIIAPSISYLAIIIVSALILAFIIGVVLVLCMKNCKSKRKGPINSDSDSFEEDDDICVDD